MWSKIIHRMLTRMICNGTLTVTWPDGTQTRYGQGTDPRAQVHFKDASIIRKLCLEPEMALGEGYVDGRIEIPEDRLRALLTLLLQNKPRDAAPVWVRLATRLRNRLQGVLSRNSVFHARRNVAHHYDISDDLYRLFLDTDMQYSCAYFTHEGMSLEEAQRAKKDHIARKLTLAPDMHVLDIGCGWGGMALTLARDYGVRVTGITLSENQLATARARAKAEGLDDVVSFHLQDYRTLDACFDRIVSVGMFEHVGPACYGDYFDQISHLLKDDGVALIHTIGVSQPARAQSRWILKYVFPGGHIPSLSQIAKPLENARLWQCDIEVLRLHYAETLHRWGERFETHADQVAEMYDAAFVRMWRYYLIASELTFRFTPQIVYQMQLAKRIDAVPLTRDYLYSGGNTGLVRAEAAAR